MKNMTMLQFICRWKKTDPIHFSAASAAYILYSLDRVPYRLDQCWRRCIPGLRNYYKCWDQKEGSQLLVSDTWRRWILSLGQELNNCAEEECWYPSGLSNIKTELADTERGTQNLGNAELPLDSWSCIADSFVNFPSYCPGIRILLFRNFFPCTHIFKVFLPFCPL